MVEALASATHEVTVNRGAQAYAGGLDGVVYYPYYESETLTSRHRIFHHIFHRIFNGALLDYALASFLT